MAVRNIAGGGPGLTGFAGLDCLVGHP
jgi:hypothetical protein